MAHPVRCHPPPRRRFVTQVAGALGVLAVSGAQAAPTAGRWRPNPSEGGWLDWRLPAAALPRPANPFDPALADLWLDFRGPAGRRLRAAAFWHRDPGPAADEGHWAVRLQPPLAGRWRATPGGQVLGQRVAGPGFTFDVAPGTPQPRCRVDAKHPTHFAFDDGRPFVPVGLNICWAASADVLGDYARWFARLAAQGGNFVRLWMASWSFGLEWKDTGLGDYGARLDRAAQLDAVMALAHRHGLQVMLCLVNHGALSLNVNSEWADNPYNAAHGGPLERPGDFVTDERAQQLFERRVRYIAARWAACPALHSWEWFNEVNWTPIAAAPLRAWHARMGRVLDAHDPYRRLRSTSWADRGDPLAWQAPELDYAQQHDYTQSDPLRYYAEQARAWRADGVRGKPLLPGELGLEVTYDPKQPRPYNFEGVHLHNGLWAPLFHGYAGTALHWWWDHMVDPLDAWPLYRGVARWLGQLHASGLRLGAHRPHAVACEHAPGNPASAAATALALAGPQAVLLWVRAEAYQAAVLQAAWRAETGGNDPAAPWQPRLPVLGGTRVRLQGLALPDGPVQVRWTDMRSGEPVGVAASSANAHVRGGQLLLDVPPFAQGLAAVVRAVSPT